MRTTAGDVTVRLSHLVDEAGGGGGAHTLMYGPLDAALVFAAGLDSDIHRDLYIATENDVVPYLDLIAE